MPYTSSRRLPAPAGFGIEDSTIAKATIRMFSHPRPIPPLPPLVTRGMEKRVQEYVDAILNDVYARRPDVFAKLGEAEKRGRHLRTTKKIRYSRLVATI